MIILFVLADTMGEVFLSLCYGSASDAHQFCCLLCQGVSILVRLALNLMQGKIWFHAFSPLYPIKNSCYTSYERVLTGTHWAHFNTFQLNTAQTMIYIEELHYNLAHSTFGEDHVQKRAVLL